MLLIKIIVVFLFDVKIVCFIIKFVCFGFEFDIVNMIVGIFEINCKC